jgi:hypothetical protein
VKGETFRAIPLQAVLPASHAQLFLFLCVCVCRTVCSHLMRLTVSIRYNLGTIDLFFSLHLFTKKEANNPGVGATR